MDDGDGVSAASASDTPSELMNEEGPCYDEDNVRYNENCQDMPTSSKILLCSNKRITQSAVTWPHFVVF